MKYRYLDLRRSVMQRNLQVRATMNQAIRTFLSEKNGFLEVETPILFRSTSEGAREFLVPTERISPGSSYALTQSPQQFKQMLMAAGVHRYYQIARCFRDEDLRADRQPEFTQLDIEMAFVSAEEVMDIMERTVRMLWQGSLHSDPFPKMTYREALARYGSDKPDLRSDMQIQTVFENGDSTTEELCLDLDHYRMVKEMLPDCVKVEEKRESAILTATRRHDDHVGQTSLGRIRTALIRKLLGARGSTEFKFLWVTDFPLLRRTEDKFESMHHPFTAPHPDDMESLQDSLATNDPSKLLTIRGQHYDLVLNGCEIGGGSIRIHDGQLQEQLFRQALNLKSMEQFAHLLGALRSGCPPHGGMALGLDRIYALLCGTDSIRDIIAFPKNGRGIDLCVNAPA